METRISRRWYGVSANTPFDKARHAKRQRHWSDIDEHWVVQDNMTWYIKKVGQLELAFVMNEKSDKRKSAKISERQPIKFNFYRAVRVDQANNLLFKDDLFFCNDDREPEFRCDSKYLESNF